jgi:adenylate cyclase
MLGTSCRARPSSSTMRMKTYRHTITMTAAPGEGTRWPSLQRSRKAIVIVDVVESVRLMQFHEDDVIERWRGFVKEVRDELLPSRGGRLVKSLGDGLLLEFDWVPSAVAAAVEMQQRIVQYNVGRLPDAVIELRVGVHVDDIVIDALDVYGAGVNLTSRLAALAKPGEVVVSPEVRDQLVPGVDADVEDMGDCFVRHIDHPLRAFRLGAASGGSPIGGAFGPRASDLRPGIGVMAFECTVGHDPGDIFGEALADEVISQLARCPELHVISGLSSRSLKGRRLPLTDIGRHLGAAYIVSGRYRLSVDTIHLNVELADVRTGHIRWADQLVTTVSAAFDPEAPLAGTVVRAVGQAILATELARAESESMQTLEGYTLLLAGISLMHRNARADFDRSRDLLEHLANRQGRRGLAHAWLAKWHVLRTVQGWTTDPKAESTQALARVERALETSTGNSLALAIGGLVHGYLRKDLDTAGRFYADALATNPNEPLAWLFSSTRHAYLGQGREAEEASDRALRLSPIDPLRYFFYSLASTAVLANGSWERGVALANESIKANRTHASTWRTLAYALVMLGRTDEANKAVRELLAIEPTYTVSAFKQRFPGSEGPMAEPWAKALGEAGLPS